MNDGEREHAHNWLLAEDNRVFFFTFSSLALAVASLLLWRAKHVDILPVNDRPDSQSAHSPQSVLTAALSTFHFASRTPGEYDMTLSQQQSTAESPTSSTAEQKPSRSKERRRRGKVPYKELVKVGKKTKVAPKVSVHQDNDHGESLTLEMERQPITNDDTIALPASRQLSPTLDGPGEDVLFSLSSGPPSAGERHGEHYPSPASKTASLPEPAPANDLPQNTIMSHHSTTGPSSSGRTRSLSPTDSPQPTESPCDHDYPAPSPPEPSSSENHDIYGLSPSTPYASTSVHVSDSSRKSQACMTSPRIKPPRFMSKQRGFDNSNGNRATSTTISGNVLLSLSTGSNHVSPRTAISASVSAPNSFLHQSSEVDISVTTSRCGSPEKLNPSPTLPHITFPTLNPLQASANDHTHTHPSIIENLNLNSKKPATPPIQTASRSSTPSIGISAHIGRTDSPVGPLSAQTQLASMRGALEAARLREEKARTEAECMAKENEELKWRWNEDVMAWRRREVDLQAQIHHLMQQLQATYSVLATLQTQAQASASFPTPTSPSPRSHPHSPNLSHNGLPQNFNYTPPSHVQALLASSYHPYPNFSSAYGGVGVSPLFFSGLGTPTSRGSSVGNGNAGGRAGHYTPDASSSAGSSPSRGRRRRRTSESSSAKENHGQGVSEEENLEDSWPNSVLADAILKRPESLRMTPSRGSLRSDGRMSALGYVSSAKDDTSRVPSRMSERSDASASRGSDGMSLSSGTGEDDRCSGTLEINSTLPEGVTSGEKSPSDLGAPTRDPSSWDLSPLPKIVRSPQILNY